MDVHHIALRTRDVDRLLAFYRDVVGLAPARDERPRSAWLRLGASAVLMLETAAHEEPTIPPGSLELLALRTDSAGRAALLERLTAAGVRAEHATEHTTYFRDPDGRRVAVSTYPL